MMSGAGKNHLAVWGAMLLPALTGVLFLLLYQVVQPPTVGGLAFLASALVAYFLFPRVRVRLPWLVLALAFGALAVALLARMLGQ